MFPESADIGPGQSVTFRVAFRPPRDGQYYTGTLDFIAHVKHMKSFRLVSEHNFNAPFHAAAGLVGNTFLHATEEFGPKFSLGASAVAFPPVRPGDAAHATLELQNAGDTAVTFDFRGSKVSPREGRNQLLSPETSVVNSGRRETTVLSSTPWMSGLNRCRRLACVERPADQHVACG